MKNSRKTGDIFAFTGFLLVAYSAFSFLNFSAPAKLDGDVLATCVSDGAYGETCVPDEDYEVEKKVRIKGNSTWNDKVTGVKEGDTVEFRIRAKNTGDEEVDDVETRDVLPAEMTRVGGAGLTESWDDFDAGETKEFIIEATLKSSEFATDKKFEKCVVNKVDLLVDGDFEDSDTATVCYNNADVEELPKTGPIAALPMGIAGVALTAVGGWLRRRS